jgi:hypothetical protein
MKVLEDRLDGLALTIPVNGEPVLVRNHTGQPLTLFRRYEGGVLVEIELAAPRKEPTHGD